MPLTVGSRLGHYDVTALIGEGGMGQVYQATDTKLNRQVALKILPEAFATDPDRLARFQREAQVLASLNHPNIAAIHGLEESDGTRALVLELVEGPTLADRIAQGAIPLDEALPIAKQIAEALEAAHEAGVIHRDLKPANIKVRDDGTVKVLDFGLAKALDLTPEGDPSQSPTLTAAATQMGVIMGTAAYMSPEQAAGKTVNKRSDIWAFGVVLYEMLAGQGLFAGETVSHVLASVLKTEPDWAVLPEVTPHSIRRLLRRCLEKDQRERLPDIGAARLDVKEAIASPAARAETILTGQVVWQRSAVLAAVGGLVVVSGFAVWNMSRFDGAQPEVTQMAILLGEDTRLGNVPVGELGEWNTPVAFVGDAEEIWFVGEQEGRHRIYRRPRASLNPTPVPGTDGARLLFPSPDGQSVGFAVGPQLKRMRLDDEAAVTFYEGHGRLTTAAWGPDDTVVFIEDANLFQIDSAGGAAPQRITSNGEYFVTGPPSFLPGGRAVLADNNAGEIMVVDLATGSQEMLTAGRAAQFVPGGLVVFRRDTSLWGISFDAEGLVARGSPVPLLEGLVECGVERHFTLSPSGTLAYVPASRTAPAQQLVWVEGEGREESVGLKPGSYRVPRISPDQAHVVFDDCCERFDPPIGDIWIYDVGTRSVRRLTLDPLNAEFHPLWTPDGERIAFFSWGGGIDWKRADGSGDVERLAAGSPLAPTAITPDGTALIASVGNGFQMVRLGGDGTLQPLLALPAQESGAFLSPDGRWLAYASDETGRFEIHVRPFPDVESGSRWQVSTEGGSEAAWSLDGRELFYRHGDQMMRVSVDTSSGFEYQPPEVLFEGQYERHELRNYDVALDGRFLMVKDVTPPDQKSDREHLVVVQNWLSEVERLVPVP